MDSAKIIDLIKTDPQMIAMALQDAAEELYAAVYNKPDDPDAIRWEESAEILEELAKLIY